MWDDPHNLRRFLAAQNGVFNDALQELRTGKKRGHWMWFVFPQLKGLGASATSQFFGLASLEEAKAYLDHPILGPRLDEALGALQASGAPSLRAAFGRPDDLKFRSSMTLFSAALPKGPYGAALERWCGGEPDPATLALLKET